MKVYGRCDFILDLVMKIRAIFTMMPHRIAVDFVDTCHVDDVANEVVMRLIRRKRLERIE